MTPAASNRDLALVGDLLMLGAEIAWVEFKENNADPEMIGRRISALANAARLADQPTAYILWGVRDGDQTPVGTDFDPAAAKVGNQPLELWLNQRLQNQTTFSFAALEYDGKRLVLLSIPAAISAPVEFDRLPYVRIGSATPRLSDHPAQQRELWAKLQAFSWETGIAEQFVASERVLSLLDYASYFELTGQPLPDNRAGIFEKLLADGLIERDVGERWNITNLGAVLFARRLSEFSPAIARKAVRFVAYAGRSRADTVTHRQDGQKGYATGFEGLVEYIDTLLPRNEFIGKAFREERPVFPSIAIRELIANALIHQDMTVTGAGPMIELFADRMEITNPGEPLITPDRFLDLPPRSRNEALASLMRRMRLCEEQGTGIDKVIVSVELHQLPPPEFRNEANAVRVILFSPRSFAEMTPEERVRACYQHAALKFVNGEKMKNATLRERFGIEDHNASQVSQVIRQALDRDLIRPADANHPQAGYVPIWA